MTAVTLISLLSWTVPHSAALPPEPMAGDRPQPKTTPAPAKTPPPGLWPTPKLTESLLIRWADGVTRRYDLTETQRQQIRRAVVDRWKPFLEQHRSELQPLLNEFLEMRLAPQPPDEETVKRWAERMAPMLEKIQRRFEEGADDFRKVLTPVQRIRFEADRARFGLGLQFARNMLDHWRQGDFVEDDVWVPTDPKARAKRRARRRERRKALGKLAREQTPPPDQIALEVDAWERYVREAAERYGFDAGQRSAAESVLEEMKGRAFHHRDLHKQEIDALERRIASFSGKDEELEELKKQLVALYGPIDEMFKELKARIESLPTSEQRRRAGVSKAEPKEETRQPASSGKDQQRRNPSTP